MTRLFVGTSGFSYKEWKGPFYPEDLPASRMLGYYAEQLPSVEINNTFYRMPRRSMLEDWQRSVPDGFRFVLKVSKRITHMQKLHETGDSVRYLLETSEALGDRRGPFLLQLPPFMRRDDARLQEFLETWPREVPAAIEFRHPSWQDDEVLAALREAGMALVIADTGDERDAAPARTASFVYARLRRPEYDDQALRDWVRRLRELAPAEAWVFFKHEDEGAGPRLATRFRELFAESLA